MTIRTWTLYRFYDAADALLYVGITGAPRKRWQTHSGLKSWWPDVVTVTVEHHPDRGSVLEAERLAIITERPRHNVVHNRHPNQLTLDQAPAETFKQFWARVSREMPDDCHDVCCRKGFLSIYYPHLWVRGMAYYTCEAGHQWTCWWAYDGIGGCDTNRGRAHARSIVDPEVVAP